MKGFSLALMLSTAVVDVASGQRRQRVFTPDPDIWLSGGVGGFTATGVNDGRTATTWNFGNSTNWQYGASLEKTVGPGTSFGIAGTYARVPFAYSGPPLPVIPGSGETCNPNCNAQLNMSTIVATFHVGSGRGFHQVIALDGGIVNYAGLKRESDGATLAGGSNTDPLFSFGWGFGYGLDDRTQIEFLPKYAVAIHERSGLSNEVSNTNSVRSLNLTLRMGFGVRSLRR